MPLFNPSQVSVTTSFPTTNTTATASTSASSITTVTLVPANSIRKGLTIWNNSTANLYLDFGINPTTSNYAVKVTPGGYYELPFFYVGAVNGVWDSANGSAMIRDFSNVVNAAL